MYSFKESHFVCLCYLVHFLTGVSHNSNIAAMGIYAQILSPIRNLLRGNTLETGWAGLQNENLKEKHRVSPVDSSNESKSRNSSLQIVHY